MQKRQEEIEIDEIYDDRGTECNDIQRNNPSKKEGIYYDPPKEMVNSSNPFVNKDGGNHPTAGLPFPTPPLPERAYKSTGIYVRKSEYLFNPVKPELLVIDNGVAYDHSTIQTMQTETRRAENCANIFWINIFLVFRFVTTFAGAFCNQLLRFIAIDLFEQFIINSLRVFGNNCLKPCLMVGFNGFIHPCLMCMANVNSALLLVYLPFCELFYRCFDRMALLCGHRRTTDQDDHYLEKIEVVRCQPSNQKLTVL